MLIHTKVEEDMKHEMDAIAKEFHFSNTSEFIRDSIRKNIEAYKKKQTQEIIKKNLEKYSVASTKRPTQKERAQAAKEALAYKGNIFKDLGLQ
ncbi:MAG: ribbon-helix-helix domain-containing protein [Candidatus Woesearchaeota archaeon]